MKRFYFTFMVMFMIVTFSIPLSGCEVENKIDEPPTSSQTLKEFFETVNNIEWKVSYYPENREIVSISTPKEIMEMDAESEFYRFSSHYHGDDTMYPIHSISYTGYPLGDDWYSIEQVDRYIMPYMEENDWERIKKTYPSCTFDPEKGYVTLSEKTTRHEEKIVFTKMPT